MSRRFAMDRRRFLGTMSALVAVAALRVRPAVAQTGPLRFADMHSHLGILGGRANVRDEMAANGLAVIAHKIVADAPVVRRNPNGSLQSFREPEPGELEGYFDRTLARLQEEHKAQGLPEITTAETFDQAMRAGGPAVVIASEGGDFLRGDLKRLEEARRRGLAHLQLVHYRVSELGDISTERPVHNGLTALGKEVVSVCNRLGVLVDVAHATSDGIAQALEISTKPMVYSHGHVTSAGPYFTQSGVRARAIHQPLARRIAEKGGVIGIWPLRSQYRTLEGYAGALIDTAETLGAGSVGVGSDMNGLGGDTVMPSYAEFAALQDVLVKRGAKAGDVTGILGGNYLRVLRQVLA